MSVQDGGAAFPDLHYERIGDYVLSRGSGGMSLRDYFAAAALTGLMSQAYGWERDHAYAEPTAAAHAQAAYALADAMLAARGLSGGTETKHG